MQANQVAVLNMKSRYLYVRCSGVYTHSNTYRYIYIYIHIFLRSRKLKGMGAFERCGNLLRPFPCVTIEQLPPRLLVHTMSISVRISLSEVPSAKPSSRACSSTTVANATGIAAAGIAAAGIAAGPLPTTNKLSSLLLD